MAIDQRTLAVAILATGDTCGAIPIFVTAASELARNSYLYEGAGVMSSPLATLTLRAASLLEQLDQSDPHRHSIEIMSQEVDRMGNLVSNLLQFSRRNQPQIARVDVCHEIESSLELTFSEPPDERDASGWKAGCACRIAGRG